MADCFNALQTSLGTLAVLYGTLFLLLAPVVVRAEMAASGQPRSLG